MMPGPVAQATIEQATIAQYVILGFIVFFIFLIAVSFILTSNAEIQIENCVRRCWRTYTYLGTIPENESLPVCKCITECVGYVIENGKGT